MLHKVLQPNSPINEDKLLSFEVRHNLVLPSTYKDFLLINNGGQPVPSSFPIEGFLDNPFGAIQAFFGLEASIPTEDLDIVLLDIHDKIPHGILPIACTDGDDFICIDLRDRGERIVFWDRKAFWGNNVWTDGDLYRVANSFESLLKRIE